MIRLNLNQLQHAIRAQVRRLYVTPYMETRVLWAAQELRALVLASPVDSGLYRRSHVYIVDGSVTSLAGIRSAPLDAVVGIANQLPYAHLIEDGWANGGSESYSKKPLGIIIERLPSGGFIVVRTDDQTGRSLQAPDGVYVERIEHAGQRFIAIYDSQRRAA